MHDESLDPQTLPDLSGARGELQCFAGGCSSWLNLAIATVVIAVLLLAVVRDIAHRGWRQALINPGFLIGMIYFYAGVLLVAEVLISVWPWFLAAMKRA